MPKETIRRLSEDVSRILVAGAHLAPSDPDLRKSHEALAALAKQLGAKAPAIARLAETAGKVIGGSGKAAATELIALATMAAQVRAAQAAAATPGALRPLAEVALVPTPCNGKDLEELRTALVEKGQGRMEVIERAIEGGYIADLRLVEPLLYAMGDPWIGSAVTDRAIPALGPAVVHPIRQRLELKNGTAVDGRRLRALVAVQKAGAIDVLSRAVKEGSAPVREAAMDAIADHVSGVAEFESYALEAIARDKSWEIRRAAIRALGGYASDASLEAILEALDKAHLMEAAAEALGKSTHPKAVSRVLERLAGAAAGAKAPARKGKAEVESESKDAVAARERARKLCELLLGSLARHESPAIAQAALPLVEEHRAPAAWAALPNANRQQLAQLADLLGGGGEDLFPVAVAAAVKLGGDEAFDRLRAPFEAGSALPKPRKGKEDKLGEKRIAAVLSFLTRNPDAVDGRLLEFLLEELRSGPREPHTRLAGVVQVLGNAREKRAVPLLLPLLHSEKKDDVLTAVIHALGRIGDPAALDAILARSDTGRLGYAVREAVLSIDDPSSVDKVRTIYVALKDPEAWQNWHMRSLLRTLECRFPGC